MINWTATEEELKMEGERDRETERDRIGVRDLERERTDVMTLRHCTTSRMLITATAILDLLNSVAHGVIDTRDTLDTQRLHCLLCMAPLLDQTTWSQPLTIWLAETISHKHLVGMRTICLRLLSKKLFGISTVCLTGVLFILSDRE